MTKFFNEALLEAMLRFVQKSDGTAVKVTAYEQVTESSGYCETCYSEYAMVYIDYDTSNGGSSRYSYYGDFGELIRELTDE